MQNRISALVIMPGSPSQAGSKPGDVCRKQAPISLWPLGAAGVQIPLPAPIYKFGLFLTLFYLKSTSLRLFIISYLLHIESWKKGNNLFDPKREGGIAPQIKSPSPASLLNLDVGVLAYCLIKLFFCNNFIYSKSNTATV